MEKYTLDRKWEYENGFYLTAENHRIGKLLNQFEIYKQIAGLPGDILEFGVYKGASFARLLAFRDLIENKDSRHIAGFDIFGKFPDDLALESDREFVKSFEEKGGYGIDRGHLSQLLSAKGCTNFQLIKGDIFNTLPQYLKANPGLRIALLHIDVDVYEPSKFILETLWDRVVLGGIVMLDDYGSVEGETKAVDEFLAEKEKKIICKGQYCYSPAYFVK